MITHRISDHIRSLNWIALSLDLFVVVFGVFLGLQVNDWNEGRKAELEEIEYLERILNDVDETIKINQEDISTIEENIRSTDFLLDAIKSGHIETNIRDQVGEALFTATRTSQIGYRHATLTEMISSGKLGLIQNHSLRNTLSDLAIWPEEMGKIIQKPEEQKTILTAEKIGFYTARRHSDGQVTIDYEPEWIVENPRVYQVLSNMQVLAGTTLQMHRSFGERYYDVRSLIEEELTRL